MQIFLLHSSVQTAEILLHDSKDNRALKKKGQRAGNLLKMSAIPNQATSCCRRIPFS